MQTVEYMHFEVEKMKEMLQSTGMKPVQLADMLETFIRTTLAQVTQLASHLTDSAAHGRIVVARDLTTSQPAAHSFEADRLEMEDE